jgi:PAS domain S-box-containing protein
MAGLPLDAFPLGITVADGQGRILQTNEAANRLLGLSTSEQMSRSIQSPEWRLLHSDGSPVAVEDLPGLRALREQCRIEEPEMGVIRPDGSVVWLNITAVPTGADQVLITYGDVSELHHSKGILVASEALYRELLERQGEGFAMVDAQECFLMANPVAEAIFGVAPGQLVGRSLMGFLAADQQEVVRRESVLRAQGTHSTYELQIHRDNGALRTLQVTATPRTTQGSEALQVIGVFRDITERKEMEEQLRVSEEKSRTYIEHSIDVIFTLDARGIFRFVSPAWERHFGIPVTEVAGKPFVPFVHPDDIEPCQAYLTRVLSSGRDETSPPYRVQHANGSWLWFRANGTRLITPDDGPWFMGVAHDITERKRAEEALKESEERLRSQFDLASEGICIMSLEGRLLEVNEALARMHGYTREEMLNLALRDLDAPESSRLVSERMHRLMVGEALTFELEHVHKDGHVFPLEVSANLISRGGQPIILAFQRDISARKHAEEALRDSQGRLQRAEAVAHLGHWELNLAQSGMLASEGAKAIYGAQGEAWSLAEVKGMVLPEYRAEMDAALANLIAHQQPYNVEFRIRRTSDGEVRDIHSVAEYDPLRQVVFGVIHDITTRRRMDEALRTSKLQYDNLAASIPVGVYVMRSKPDGAMAFEYVSPRMAALLGMDHDALQRDVQIAFQAVHRDDSEAFIKLNQDGLRLRVPFDWTGRMFVDGATRWFHIESNPRSLDDGDVLWHGVVTDVTERKSAEEERRHLQAQLHHAQKMESLGSLAGGVAHDMNNVLGAILGLASAHIEAQPPASPAHQAFDTISKAAIRGGKLVKSLLSFARQGPAEERELDLNAILQEEVSLLDRTTLSKVRLIMDLASDLQPIRGDASALTHAFLNLCVNAVDAMPGNGTLTLRTRNVDARWIEAQVEDTGSGMAPAVLQKAMDPFFTTKEVGKGTGLGLSIVYSTVKAHQGQMEILSESGRGTCVTMRFPVCGPGTKRLEGSGAHRAMAPRKALNVLLVDDDQLIQSTVQTILEVLGHAVTPVFSGEDALARLEAGLQPDLVILDLNMPGLGGVGTLPRLRALRATLPILVTTGRVDQTALDLVEAHPHVGLLAKPFSLKELEAHLDAIARSQG